MELKEENKRSAYSFKAHFIALFVGAAVGGLFATVAGFSSDAIFYAVIGGAILGEIIGIGFNAANRSGEV